jgi:hypothetical protein
MAAITLFVAGAAANLYVRVPPEGSPFKRIARVLRGERAMCPRVPRCCHIKTRATPQPCSRLRAAAADTPTPCARVRCARVPRTARSRVCAPPPAAAGLPL